MASSESDCVMVTISPYPIRVLMISAVEMPRSCEISLTLAPEGILTGPLGIGGGVGGAASRGSPRPRRPRRWPPPPCGPPRRAAPASMMTRRRRPPWPPRRRGAGVAPAYAFSIASSSTLTSPSTTSMPAFLR